VFFRHDIQKNADNKAGANMGMLYIIPDPRKKDRHGNVNGNREIRHAQRSIKRSIRMEHENRETAKHG
jgi:hypothetical protein